MYSMDYFSSYTIGEEQTELISGISLGAILAIVICLYTLTTIILVLRIKILSGNARQQSPVDCTSVTFVRQIA